METNSLLKAEMIEIFSSEIDQWLATGHHSDNGFDYEASFVETLRRVEGLAVFKPHWDVCPKVRIKKTSKKQKVLQIEKKQLPLQPIVE